MNASYLHIGRNFIFLCVILFGGFLNAQTNDTPMRLYEWSGKKTVPKEGYVVLKSGKKLEGVISLKGSSSYVKEVNFEGNGRQFLLPVAALDSYGLTIGGSAGGAVSGVLVNESPESMYEWRNIGEVMGKTIETTVPRDGYVVLHDGTRYDGKMKLKKKAGVLVTYEVKTTDGKEKGSMSDVARYGYNMSAEELEQQQLASKSKSMEFYKGTIASNNGMQEGEIAKISVPGKFYFKEMVFKDAQGKLTTVTHKEVEYVNMIIEGESKKYIPKSGAMVEELFHGSTFVMYRNPKPTSVNNFMSSLVKSGAQMGAEIAAASIANKDAEKRGYESNMDSIIGVASTEELIAIQEGMIQMSGYSDKQDFLDNAPDGALKANVSAIDLALIGREIGSSDLEIYNKEWVIYNEKTGERTVVYKNDYKDLIEPLLMGCYTYLTMEKSDQKDCRSFKRLKETLVMLDECY